MGELGLNPALLSHARMGQVTSGGHVFSYVHALMYSLIYAHCFFKIYLCFLPSPSRTPLTCLILSYRLLVLFAFLSVFFSCSREGKSPVKKIMEWVNLIVSCVPWSSGHPPPQKAFRSRLYVLITLFTPFPCLSPHCPITVNKNMFAGTNSHT